MTAGTYQGCQLDFILQVHYGFGINDIDVDMEASVDIADIEKQLGQVIKK